MAADWLMVQKSAYDTSFNLVDRFKVIRHPLVQKTYNNLYIKHTPPDGLSTNRFPHYTKPGIHNYIYWTDDWNVSEETIRPFFPHYIDLVSYVNPPHIRSMGHKPHRNIYIRGADGIPKIEHIFDQYSHIHSNNLSYMIWTSDDINNLWMSPVFDSFRHYRRANLDRIAVLLYYGGVMATNGIYSLSDNYFNDGGIIINNKNIINSDILGATPFDPLIFDYLHYITNQVDPNRMITTNDFIQQLSPWEQNRIIIL